jgi:hypothetical protein
MRFNFLAKIFNHTFFCMLAETQTLNGITSKTPEGLHYVFWDLEKCTLEQTKETLRLVQEKFNLSDIFLTSDYENSYRAWCFSKVSFKSFLKILLYTEHVDYDFFYWTVRRSKATLRTTDKKGRKPQKIIVVLESYPVPIPEVFETVEYDTGVQKRGRYVKLGTKERFWSNEQSPNFGKRRENKIG